MYFRKTTYILRSPERRDQLGKEADQDHSVSRRDHAVPIDVRGFLLLGRELHQIRQAAREHHRVGRGHQTVTVEVAKQILRLPAHGTLPILIGVPSGRDCLLHDRAAVQTCHDPQAVLRAGRGSLLGFCVRVAARSRFAHTESALLRRHQCRVFPAGIGRQLRDREHEPVISGRERLERQRAVQLAAGKRITVGTIEHNTLFQYRLRILLRRIDRRADLRHGVDGPDRPLQCKGAAGRKLVIRENLVRDGNRFIIGNKIDIRSLQPLAVTRFAPDAAACPGAGTDLDVNALIHRADRLGGIRLGVQVRVRPGASVTATVCSCRP